MAAVATTNFADRLAEAVERKRTQLVVGLDPRPDLLPVELKGDAHLGREEAAGAYARAAGLHVVADGKRGDIGSTARAYVAAFLESRHGKTPLADAMTVNPY